MVDFSSTVACATSKHKSILTGFSFPRLDVHETLFILRSTEVSRMTLPFSTSRFHDRKSHPSFPSPTKDCPQHHKRQGQDDLAEHNQCPVGSRGRAVNRT